MLNDDYALCRLRAVIPHLLREDFTWISFLIICPYPLPFDRGYAEGLVVSGEGLDKVWMSVVQVSEPGWEEIERNLRVARQVGVWAPDLESSLATFSDSLRGWPRHDSVVMLRTRNALVGDCETSGQAAALLLERCLEGFNSWLRGFRLVTEAAQPFPMTFDQLPMLVFASTHADELSPVWNGFILSPVLFRPVFRSPVPTNEWESRFRQVELTPGHPKNAFLSWRLHAERMSYYEGESALAVICLQTAIEALVSGVHDCLPLSSEGTRVAKTFRPRLHGVIEALGLAREELEDPHSPVGGYKLYLYDLRNSIVHEGIDVSVPQVDKAFAGMDNFVAWLGEQLVQKRHSYPHAALMFHGSVGLARLDALDDFMQRFIIGMQNDEREINPWVRRSVHSVGGAEPR